METFVRLTLLLVLLCTLTSCKKARNVQRIPVNMKRAQLMNIEAQVIKQAMIDENSSEPPVVECGKPNSQSTSDYEATVIKEADENEFPWQAALLIHTGKSFFYCGGSLINSYWVLTSAHCVDEAAAIYIFLGSHNITASSEPHRQVHVTDVYYIHPDWNGDDLAGDIALVQLVFPVTFNEHIKPICLPENNDNDQPGDLVILTGWGRSEGSRNLSDVLRESSSVVISNERCSKFYDIITNEILCTNGSTGATCNADSGGPLHYVDSDGIYTQIGIVSFGSDQGCSRKSPTGFTRIESYLDWIDFVLNPMQDLNTTDAYEEYETEATRSPNKFNEDEIDRHGSSENDSVEDKLDQSTRDQSSSIEIDKAVHSKVPHKVPASEKQNDSEVKGNANETLFKTRVSAKKHQHFVVDHGSHGVTQKAHKPVKHHANTTETKKVTDEHRAHSHAEQSQEAQAPVRSSSASIVSNNSMIFICLIMCYLSAIICALNKGPLLR